MLTDLSKIVGPNDQNKIDIKENIMTNSIFKILKKKTIRHKIKVIKIPS